MITLLKKWIVEVLRAASRKDPSEFNRLGTFYYFFTRSPVRSAWLAFWHKGQCDEGAGFAGEGWGG